jgi:hypothetical protein
MTLENLTREQVALCDIMWSLDTTEELDSFMQGLPAPLRKEAETLVQLIVLDELDNQPIDMDSANQLIRNILDREY